MHKTVQDRTVSIISYMASQGGPDWKFLGFAPIDPIYDSWGVEINGVGYAGMYAFEERSRFGDDGRETQAMITSKPHVLLFYGSDNSSYFKRFHTRKSLDRFVHDLVEINERKMNLLFYNS